MKATALPGNREESLYLAPFKELLLRTCGSSFENEREKALSTAICRRMTALGRDGYGAYYTQLQSDQDELLRLTELLTVNETYFLREPDHLNLMVDMLLPELMVARNMRPIRILSAGCSTGEEPYSIALLLYERFGIASARMFTITGVDIDSTVIASAKLGLYGRSSFRGMSQALLERYFEPVGLGEFRVRDFIRKMVGFEVVNLLGNSYPERMQSPDIILYRNVSIYFPEPVQREIFAKLAEILVVGGCLLVGAAETIHHDIGILSLVSQNALFFYRKTPPQIFEERRSSSRRLSFPETSQVGSTYCTTSHAAKIAATTQTEQVSVTSPKQSPQAIQKDVKEQFNAAVQLAHARQYDKALSVLDDIIVQDTGFEKAYCLKGSLLLSLSRFGESRIVCETILQRDTLCLIAYLMLGMLARQDGDNDEAMRRFREAIYLDPACWLAHFYSAEIMYMQQDVKRAKSGYETAVRILEKGSIKELGQAFFPLSFNAEQFIVIGRHKLSLLAQGTRSTR